MNKTLQTNRTGLCLRNLSSEQDGAQQKKANQKKCVGTYAEQGGSRRQKEPRERSGSKVSPEPSQGIMHLPSSKAGPSSIAVERKSFLFHL